MGGKCEEAVYGRGSQYERLVGRPCTRNATVKVTREVGEAKVERHLCTQHARSYSPALGWKHENERSGR